MDDGTASILMIVVNVLVGIVSFLTSGICILIWNKINSETKDRKEAIAKEEKSRKDNQTIIYDKMDDNTKGIAKNKNNTIKIATSLDIDLES